jgi:nucleoside-diphosphate-sugar epimerase
MQWVHVDDLAEGIVLAGTRLEAANNIFNIAGDEVFTQLDILRALWKNWRKLGARQAYRPVRGCTKGHGSLKYDISKAWRLLGFTPKIKLADGVQEIVSTMDQRQPWGEG